MSDCRNPLLVGRSWAKAFRCLSGAFGLLAVASTANAIPLIDFFMDTSLPPSGVLIYGGAGGPLTAVGIDIHSVTASDTANAGTYGCIGCALGFQTGDLSTANSSTWLFEAQSSTSLLTISGGLDVNGDNVSDLAFSFAGDFAGSLVQVDLLSTDLFDSGLVTGAFEGTFDPGFMSFFDLPSDSAGTLVLEWIGFGRPPGALVANARSALASVAFGEEPPPPPPPPPPIAEPGTLLLLGAGLLLAAATRRRE